MVSNKLIKYMAAGVLAVAAMPAVGLAARHKVSAPPLAAFTTSTPEVLDVTSGMPVAQEAAAKKVSAKHRTASRRRGAKVSHRRATRKQTAHRKTRVRHTARRSSHKKAS